MKVANVVRGFASFWNDTIPFCDVLVGEINKYLYMAFSAPLESRIPNSRHALVNELGFDLFRASIDVHETVRSFARSVDARKRIEADVRQRLARFMSAPPAPCSKDEVGEAIELAERLDSFFAPRVGLKTRLVLAGCGWLPACEADAWRGRTLYEIKAGDRPFLGADIRQLLVYCAMNSESQQYEIDRVSLVNPRRGRYYEVGLEELCIRVAGTGPYEVTNSIINLLTSGGTSP